MFDQIPDFIILHAKTVGSVAAIVFLGLLFYMLARKAVSMLGARGALAESGVRVLRLYLRWIFVLVLTLLVLQEIGVLQNVWSAFLAILAVIAVGFVAVWSVLSNALCTLLILVYKPFSIGDDIALPSDNLSGKVEDMNLMFTTLVDEKDGLVQIPNNQFFQKAICRKRGTPKETLYDRLTRKNIAD